MNEAIEPYDEEWPFRYHGKLLLKREIPLSYSTIQRLLQLSYFTPISSFTYRFLEKQCKRCGNRKASLLGEIPCPLCGKTHLYCRKCIQMGRVMECEPLYVWTGPTPKWKEYPSPCTWKGSLTKTQQKAAHRIVEAIKQKEKDLLIWAVTGSGKTEMLFNGITKALQLGRRICIATPRQDVVRELLPRLKEAFSTVPIEGLYAGSKDRDGDSQLMIATTHQLLRFQEAFDVLIIDEIDAFPYHKDPSLPFAAKRAIKKDGTTIYLTATPNRHLQKRIRKNELAHVFVPERFHGHPLIVPSFKMCFSLRKNLNDRIIPDQIVNWIKQRNNKQRQLLIFLPTISLTENLLESVSTILYKENIVKAKDEVEAVHAEDVNREKKIQLFRDRTLTVLLTTTILERGVTFPSVDVIILQADHDVFDEAALVQIVGRAGRSIDDPKGQVVFFHQGKTNAMVRARDLIEKMNKQGGFR